MRVRLLLLATLLAAGCPRRSAPPPPASPPPAPAARAAALPLVGRFTGTLPCADCAGIETELTLAGDWDGRTLYHLKETYVGAPGGPRTVESEGTWATRRGTPLDRAAKVYQLNPDTPATTRYFVVIDERTIRLLDADLQPLPASEPTSLTRSD